MPSRKLSELAVGDWFRYDHVPYMKLTRGFFLNVSVNSISLRDARPVFIHEDVQVEPLGKPDM